MDSHSNTTDELCMDGVTIRLHGFILIFTLTAHEPRIHFTFIFMSSFQAFSLKSSRKNANLEL